MAWETPIPEPVEDPPGHAATINELAASVREHRSALDALTSGGMQAYTPRFLYATVDPAHPTAKAFYARAGSLVTVTMFIRLSASGNAWGNSQSGIGISLPYAAAPRENIDATSYYGTLKVTDTVGKTGAHNGRCYVAGGGAWLDHFIAPDPEQPHRYREVKDLGVDLNHSVWSLSLSYVTNDTTAPDQDTLALPDPPTET